MSDPAAIRAEYEAALAGEDLEELARLPVWISLDPLPDEEETAWAEGICLRLAGHEDRWVRGNAVLGLGHLARTLGQFADPEAVRRAVEAGLADADDHVRGQADCAASDLHHFLGWEIAGYAPDPPAG